MGQELILDPSLLAIQQPPRQPREGGMAVARLWNAKPIPSGPAVYNGGVETSSTQNPQNPGQHRRPLHKKNAIPRIAIPQISCQHYTPSCFFKCPYLVCAPFADPLPKRLRNHFTDLLTPNFHLLREAPRSVLLKT
jgi:hypothetical protein